MKPHTVKVKDFIDYVTLVNKLGYRGWIFRGHSDSSWQIESSLTRFYRTHQKNIASTSQDIRERDSIKKFQKAAREHINNPPDNQDWISWLAVMQHFGAPTRLIDFTFNPLSALYFALEEAVKPVPYGSNPTNSELNKNYKPFVIHALHLSSYKKLAISVLKANNVKIKSSNPEKSDYLIGYNSKQTMEFVGFAEGTWLNPRQIAQQGVFMIPSKIELDIENYLHTSKEKPNPYQNPWIKFEFKGGRPAYKQLVKNLIISNNTANNLFPGIEGVAKGLFYRMYEVVKELD